MHVQPLVVQRAFDGAVPKCAAAAMVRSMISVARMEVISHYQVTTMVCSASKVYLGPELQ